MVALPAQAAALFAATALAVAAPAPEVLATDPSPAADGAVAPATGEPPAAPAAPVAGSLPELSASGAPAAAPAPEAPHGRPVAPQAEPAADLPAPPAEAPAQPAATTEPAADATDHVGGAPAAAQTSAAPPRAAPAGTSATPRAAPGAGPAVPAPEPAPAVPGCAVDLILGVTPIVGTDGDDVLNGTPGNDFICGLGGNDTIDAGEGDDTIDGGDGDDAIDGGGGADRIRGGLGNDTLDAGAGADQIAAGDGDDTADGGDGDDCIGGGPGNDYLAGGPGNDALEGQGGSDVLLGQGGADAGEPTLDDEEPGEWMAWFEAVLSGDRRECSLAFGLNAPSASPGTSRGDDQGARGRRARRSLSTRPMTHDGRHFAATVDRDAYVGFFEDLANQAREVIGRVADLGVASADASDEAAQQALRIAFALAPLERPLLVGDDGVARMLVTCGTSFSTSRGSVTLRTKPQSANRKPRPLGEAARFACSPTRRTPLVEIELPAKDRLLVKQLGRLRVRATAEATNETGATTEAASHFTLVPKRP